MARLKIIKSGAGSSSSSMEVRKDIRRESRAQHKSVTELYIASQSMFILKASTAYRALF